MKSNKLKQKIFLIEDWEVEKLIEDFLKKELDREVLWEGPTEITPKGGLKILIEPLVLDEDANWFDSLDMDEVE